MAHAEPLGAPAVGGGGVVLGWVLGDLGDEGSAVASAPGCAQGTPVVLSPTRWAQDGLHPAPSAWEARRPSPHVPAEAPSEKGPLRPSPPSTV